jgi:lipopolysaccharide transport system ATP-binding protein
VPPPAIRIENLSKQYQVGAQASRHTTFREALSGLFTNPVKRFRSLAGRVAAEESFWALKDVSFEVQPGEAVGIIGRNGAGKSTLLKVLSQITEPTEGRIEINGRVASLLEVGTGFHPELTGRENIFVNGSILGMSRTEIQQRFDGIVEFSGVERFLDTPIKRYSSGMTVRLAFSVAAHLDPEILIVDEVLAVGDIAFQRKCIGKMREVGRSGRTILFVSHNLSAIRGMCSRAIWLEHGRCRAHGDTGRLLSEYSAVESRRCTRPKLATRTDRGGTGRARVVGVRLTNDVGQEIESVCSGDDFAIHLQYRLPAGEHEIKDVIASIALSTDEGYVWLVRSSFTGERLDLSQREGEIICRVSDFAIAEGSYQLTLFLSHRDTEVLDYVPDASEFRVGSGDYFGTGSQGLPTHCRSLTRADWTV